MLISLTLTSSKDSSFTSILDVLQLGNSDEKDDDDRDDDSDDDFVCRAGDTVCDAAKSVETCEDFCGDDTYKDDDDIALAASSGIRISGISHGETEGILGSFSLHFEPSTDCK